MIVLNVTEIDCNKLYVWIVSVSFGGWAAFKNEVKLPPASALLVNTVRVSHQLGMEHSSIECLILMESGDLSS